MGAKDRRLIIANSHSPKNAHVTKPSSGKPMRRYAPADIQAQRGEAVLSSSRARYLFGHFSKSMLWHTSCWLFAFHLTEQCDIPPLTMSLVLGIALGCNAIIDAVTGYWLKRNANAARIANRYQLLGASIAGGAFVAFAGCSLVQNEWRFACALGSLTLFRCTYPLLDVAQNALGARIATSGAERRRVVAQRHVASGIAGICVAFGIAPILIAGGADAPAKFVLAAAITAAMAWIGAAIQPDLDVVPVTTIGGAELIEAGSVDYKQALMLICVAGLAGTAFSKLLPYFLAFSSPFVQAAPLLGWVAIGTCSSQFVWLAVRARYSENLLGLIAC
ncbi:MFS transporter, partial [Novosphingobium sp. 11B]